MVKGKITRVLPVANGVAKVELQAEKTLPEAHPTVDALVQLEVLQDVLYFGRPAVDSSQSEGVLFKLDADGQQARKVNVRYGRASVNTVEVLSGLQPGDQVILSDMSAFCCKGWCATPVEQVASEGVQFQVIPQQCMQAVELGQVKSEVATQ